MIALGYKESADVVAKIDRIVMDRRRQNPAVTYSRAKFIREIVNRALADVEASQLNLRRRTRERVSQ